MRPPHVIAPRAGRRESLPRRTGSGGEDDLRHRRPVGPVDEGAHDLAPLGGAAAHGRRLDDAGRVLDPAPPGPVPRLEVAVGAGRDRHAAVGRPAVDVDGAGRRRARSPTTCPRRARRAGPGVDRRRSRPCPRPRTRPAPRRPRRRGWPGCRGPARRGRAGVQAPPASRWPAGRSSSRSPRSRPAPGTTRRWSTRSWRAAPPARPTSRRRSTPRRAPPGTRSSTSSAGTRPRRGTRGR